jgi:hypothetical protein
VPKVSPKTVILADYGIDGPDVCEGRVLAAAKWSWALDGLATSGQSEIAFGVGQD